MLHEAFAPPIASNGRVSRRASRRSFCATLTSMARYHSKLPGSGRQRRGHSQKPGCEGLRQSFADDAVADERDRHHKQPATEARMARRADAALVRPAGGLPASHRFLRRHVPACRGPRAFGCVLNEMLTGSELSTAKDVAESQRFLLAHPISACSRQRCPPGFRRCCAGASNAIGGVGSRTLTICVSNRRTRPQRTRRTHRQRHQR